MDKKEIYLLSKTGCERKSFVKSTRKMLTKSFSIIFISMWFIISFYIMLLSVKDASPTALIVHKEEYIGLMGDLVLPPTDIFDKFEHIEKIGYYGFNYTNNQNFSTEFKIDNKIYQTDKQNFSMQLVDTIESKNKFALDTYTLKSEKQALLAGGTFYNTAKAQILITKKFCNDLGFDFYNAVGKKISFSIDIIKLYSFQYYLVDNDNNSDNVFDVKNASIDNYYIKVFKDYEIVGIIDETVINNGYDMIISSENLDNNSLPTIRTENDYRIMTYENANVTEYSQYIVDQGKVFLMPYTNWGGFDGYWYRQLNPQYNSNLVKMTDIHLKDYKSVKKLNKNISKILFNELNWTEQDIESLNSVILSSEYMYITDLTMQANKVLVFMLIFATIIALASIMNFYNVFAYLKKERNNISRLYHFIGMNTKDIKQLYFYENTQVFIKAYIKASLATLILGTVSTIIIFKMAGRLYRSFLSIGAIIGGFLITLVLGAILSFALTFLFSFRKSSK